MQIPKKLNNVIDFLGIIVPLIVDLVLNVVSFSILAPDTLSRIAFIALAIMIVIFVPRAWSKRQFVSYAIFVIVVVFADWSFTLATTGEVKQSVNTVITEDIELQRIEKNIERTEKLIENLHRQYYEAQRRDTLAEINAQIETENIKLQGYEEEYKERFNKLNIQNEKTKLTADDIFNAIPIAIKNKRYIPLVVWFFVFIGVQLVVATSIDIKKNTATASEPRPAVNINNKLSYEDISKWVHISWYNVSNQGTNIILSQEAFFKLSPDFNLKKYEAIKSLAINRRVIDNFNHALVIDETRAAEKIYNG